MNDELFNGPCKVDSIYFSHLWGGTLLRDRLNKPIPGPHIGESWEISALPGKETTVILPRGEKLPFSQYAQNESFYGAQPYDKFPLLIKFIGAAQDLSVQVHPSDDTALPGEYGKSEAWMVIDAPKGAQLVAGITKGGAEFARLVQSGQTAQCLRKITVQPGDVLYIQPGLVHAIAAGITLYEVQQSSDTTFRLYDYDRLDAATGEPRQLHIERALAVTDATLQAQVTRGAYVQEDGARRALLLHTPFFALERLDIDGRFADVDWGAYAIYSVIQGQGVAQGPVPVPVQKGDTFVQPAAAGPLVFEGRASLIKAHMPPCAPYGLWLEQKGCRVVNGVVNLR